MTSPTPKPDESNLSKDNEQVSSKPIQNIALDISADQGLPEIDIDKHLQNNTRTSLVRDPTERNIPKLFVDNDILRNAVYTSVTNLDDPELLQLRRPTDTLQNVPTSGRPSSSHQIIRIIENEHEPTDEYQKKQISVNGELIIYDKNAYNGPFGFSRKGSLTYYIIVGLFTLLSAALLIMTGVFYAQNYPNANSTTGILTGLGICAFSFYLSLQLFLIGMWSQKYRRENPIRRIHIEPTVRSDSKDHLKTSMETNESFDHSYSSQPYGYYSNPSHEFSMTEQDLFQQPGVIMGSGSYDPIARPMHVRVETEPEIDPKFLQPTLGLAQPSTHDTALEDMQIKKNHRTTENPIEGQPTLLGDFDSIQWKSAVIEQPLPILPNAPETSEIIQTLPKIERSSSSSDILSKKKNRINPMDSKTDINSSTVLEKDNDNDQDHSHHHHRHHHRRHHSHDHHHHRHHHRHHHHHHSPHRHHHHHHHHSHSSYDHYLPHIHSYPEHQFHHQMSLPPPQVIAPYPKIITPHPPKNFTKTFRETAVNTGKETKIMRETGVNANLEDLTNQPDNRLDKIPVVRRTIIVEPYPAQPSSQIIVKPRADMIGKISLNRDPNTTNEKEEQYVYPASVVLSKQKSKKKKKKNSSSIVNDNVIEDLDLEEISENDKEFDQSLFTKRSKSSTRKTIKNAFYN